MPYDAEVYETYDGCWWGLWDLYAIKLSLFRKRGWQAGANLSPQFAVLIQVKSKNCSRINVARITENNAQAHWERLWERHRERERHREKWRSWIHLLQHIQHHHYLRLQCKLLQSSYTLLNHAKESPFLRRLSVLLVLIIISYQAITHSTLISILLLVEPVSFFNLVCWLIHWNLSLIICIHMFLS